MPKDFTAELVSSKLPERPLDIHIGAYGTPQKFIATASQPTLFGTLFSLYRNYKEYDYEDWHVAKPSRSYGVLQEVEASLLYYAHKSLEPQQNSIDPTLWDRIKKLATNLAQRLVGSAPMLQRSASHIAKTAQPTTKLLSFDPRAGFVAQIVLRPDYPSPQTDLAYGYGTRYAKSCEAIQDRGTDLDLRNLPIEVAGREALTE